MPKPKRSEFPDFANTKGELGRLQENFLLYAGNTAVNFFQDSFRRKGFVNKGNTAWKDRKPPKGKKKAKGSLLMVTGRLKNSIRITEMGKDEVRIGTDVPYAEVHNEGSRKLVSIKPHKRQNIIRAKVRGGYAGTAKKSKAKTIELLGKRGNVKGYQYKQNIPKRQFIGESDFLLQRIEKNLDKALDTFIDNIL